MRIAFIETLTKLAEQDENVFLITGDLGFSVFENFKERFPNQYLNVGVAEQNMVGIAAGMALLGKRPFVYSITTFATMRPYEQIRNDVCYQNLPVTIIGGGSTFSYSTFGCTHMPLEDISIMRSLPRMSVFVPGDAHEVISLLHHIYNNNSPAYLRIAKRGEPEIHNKQTLIEGGKAIIVRAGHDATIISTGVTLSHAVIAAEKLAEEGISVQVLSMHTIKPIDEKAILAAAETNRIVTVEEHNVIGGLGSAVAEVLVKHNKSVSVKTLGVTDEFPPGVGKSHYFHKRYKLDVEGICQSVKKLL